MKSSCKWTIFSSHSPSIFASTRIHRAPPPPSAAAASSSVPIVRQKKSASDEAAAKQLSMSELSFPEQLAPIFQKVGAFGRASTASASSNSSSSSSSAATGGGLPRCGWGYLYRLSTALWNLSNESAAAAAGEGQQLQDEAAKRDLLVGVRTSFPRECDFILDSSNAGTLIRNLREAQTLLVEAGAANDDSLRDLAVEEIEHIAASFPCDDAWEMLMQVAEESDELNSLSDKWTLETMGRAGGVESALFAKELLEMYRHYCEKVRRWQVEDLSEPDAAGGTLRVVGRDVYKYMRNEIGVHRVQRVPVTESSGRMQTSTASVFLLPQPSAVSVNINPQDVEIEMCRGGGPGGQGVNSSSNMCRLLHKPTGINIRCHQARSGNANREMAMDMLAQRLWKEQYRSSKKQQDEIFSSQWGSGERGERMRTYNFPQNRITDHRFNNWTCNASSAFMSGVGPLEELHDMAVAASTLQTFKTAMDSRMELLEQKLSPV